MSVGMGLPEPCGQVRFVRLRPDHIHDIARLAELVHVDLLLSAVVRNGGADRFVMTSRAEWALGASMRLAIECDGRFAGYAALARLQTPPAQLEFAVLPEYRGNGLSLAATKALIAHALRRQVNVIETVVLSENAASIAVLCKAGFSPLDAKLPQSDTPMIWRWQGTVNGISV